MMNVYFAFYHSHNYDDNLTAAKQKKEPRKNYVVNAILIIEILVSDYSKTRWNVYNVSDQNHDGAIFFSGNVLHNKKKKRIKKKIRTLDFQQMFTL